MKSLTGILLNAILILCCIHWSASNAWAIGGGLAQDQDRAFNVAPDALTDREIQWAIAALKDGLYGYQNRSGTWERQYPQADLSHLNAHESGQTTLAVYALLASGDSYQDPRLKPAVDFLLSSRTDYTYVRSLRAHIWALLPARFEEALDSDRKWLLNSYGFNSGSWNYTSTPMQSGYDNSLTQYGVLGLWEAAKRGLDVPERLWDRVERHYLRTQLVDGGWNYRPQWNDARGSMTAAGLTCLFITQDYLHAEEYVKPGGRERSQQKAIRLGLKWFDQHFTVAEHPGVGANDRQNWYFYYLYGVERVGLASGYRRFADQDWYREGAAAIINRLCEPVRDPETDWITGYRMRERFQATGSNEVPAVQVSFALLFLSHGRSPIIISKLQDEGMAWNNRPRDAANLTRWISDEVEERRAWQILDMDRPFEEWFSGPIVYLATHQVLPYVKEHERTLRLRDSGRDPEALKPTDLERIREYLELGGTLLTNTDGGRKGASDSVRELAITIFPEFEWRRLPEDHWVFTMSAPVQRKPAVYGLTNGVRELIIHFDRTDVGAALQVNDRRRFKDTFALLSNVYYYASERGITRARLEPKLERGIDEMFEGIDAREFNAEFPRRKVNVWRGVYEGNWNPERGADDVLSVRLARERALDVQFVDVPLEEVGDDREEPYRTLLWVRGVDAHPLSDDQASAILRFLDAGGTILVETVGGVGEFAADFEAQLQSLLNEGGEEALMFRPIARHPVATGTGLARGVNCTNVNYRLFSLEMLGTRERIPRMRSVDSSAGHADAPRIFVSREDLSHGILGQTCWGISGYVSNDASHLAGNLIEYAARLSE